MYLAFEKITASPRRLLVAVVLFILLDLSILLINLWIAHQVALDAVAINLAGRQRMLSQRITKATLIAADQPKTPLGEQARGELDAAYRLFTRTLHAFDRGGETPGGDGQLVTLRPVDDPKGRQAIQTVLGHWQNSLHWHQRLERGDLLALQDFRQFMVDHNLLVLDAMNSLTTALEHESIHRINSLRLIQTGAFVLAMLNFVVILMGLIKQNRRSLAIQQQWREVAQRDSLTGVMNRAAFDNYLSKASKEAARNHKPLSLLLLDLDGFKPINDTLGHAIGDVVLQDFAQCLQKAARTSDTVARLGGDEFVIICPDLGDSAHIRDFCDRLFAQLARITVPHNPNLIVGASVGIATSPRDATVPTKLLQRADAAMYHAKRLGGNRYCLATELPEPHSHTDY
jgi:diguanylate cyclase (GGDEF)-like protein